MISSASSILDVNLYKKRCKKKTVEIASNLKRFYILLGNIDAKVSLRNKTKKIH